MSLPLPSLLEMTAWSLAEVQAAITVYKPTDWAFDFEDVEGVWYAQFLNAEGEVLFSTAHPDPRLALLNAYGHVWNLHFKSSNPMWERRRDDLREVARRGLMYIPGAENVPDPEDLDPDPVYEGESTRRTR